MNKYGAVLDDFGMESMLEKLMEEFIRHISKSKFFFISIYKKCRRIVSRSLLLNLFLVLKLYAVFFLDVGGYSLDSHHGFVVEYGMDRDVELGMYICFFILNNDFI